MKTKLLFAYSLFIVFFATSCNFSENIIINEDGSGKISIDVDGSQLMALAANEIAKEGGPTRIDSVMSFKQLLEDKKDSIAQLPLQEQQRLKKLEKFSIKMLMDTETSEMNMSIYSNFNKAEELHDAMAAFNNVGSMAKPEKDMKLGMLQNKSAVSYAYSGKKFERRVAIIDRDEKTEEESDTEDMYKAMFGSSTYSLNYTFPNRIKKVTNSKAIISEDKKSVSVSYSLLEYFDDPQAMAIAVEFE